MKQVELSSPPLLESKLWPAYTGIMLLVMWFPMIWPIAYICGIILGLMISRTFILRKVVKTIELSFRQKEDLLFVEDEELFYLTFQNVGRLKEWGLSASIRLLSRQGLTFTDDSNVYTFNVDNEKTLYKIPVRAGKRGPTGIDTCTISMEVPFFLGTILLTYSKEALPKWTVLPSIQKAHLPTSKNFKLGDRLVKYSPLKDPLMIQGTKDYEKEPAKQIDWYATAKTGKMQSKVFQRQNQDTFTLMLDLNTPQGNGLHAQFERLIEHAAYLITKLIKEDCKIELFINRLDESNHLDQLLLSDGRKQLRNSLIRLSQINESDHLVASKRFTTIVDRKKQPQSELIVVNHASIF